MSVIFKIKAPPNLLFNELSAKQTLSQIEQLMYTLAGSVIFDVVKQQALHLRPPGITERMQRRREALEQVTRPYLLGKILSFLPYDSLLNASLVSKRFHAAAQQLLTVRRQRVLDHFPECFTLSISRKIFQQADLPLDRSTELFTCSYNTPVKGRSEPRKLSLMAATPDLLEMVRHSGSRYAISPPIQKEIGIRTLEELRGLIVTFPDEWLREINGLDLKGFDLTQDAWFEDLEEIIRLCPELVKVLFYTEDIPDARGVSMLDKLNLCQDRVKIRIAHY